MIETLEQIANGFAANAPKVDYWSLRLVSSQYQSLHVRQNILQPLQNGNDCGAYIAVRHGKGAGYAATCDLSKKGLLQAAERAFAWARAVSEHNLLKHGLNEINHKGEYHTQQTQDFDQLNLHDRIDLVKNACEQLKTHANIVDWHAYLSLGSNQQLVTSSTGAKISQAFHYCEPGMSATAHNGKQTQTRTGGGWGSARQGGLEQLDALNFPSAATQISEEALQLLDAPPCPDGKTDLLLLPGQMMLQIHESIGHPLELDRILGDERNYAGTSFVTMDMFGQYQYGSEYLNILFDPGVSNEMASYAYDDHGSAAEPSYIIRQGILLTPLGGADSQLRAGLPGVANARACDWNRPPIDRMANLNLEPGDSSFDDLVQKIENGILMDSNRSWSIDDSRNKFQFGCEFGRVIKDGQLQGLVRNPNYRGISANFWRSLDAVGNQDTMQVLGTPNCGKGEPNQMLKVGHASPACVFRGVDVFGGS